MTAAAAKRYTSQSGVELFLEAGYEHGYECVRTVKTAGGVKVPTGHHSADALRLVALGGAPSAAVAVALAHK